MALKLVREEVDDGSIPARELKDDQAAEIVAAGNDRYVGHSVKRNGEQLVGLSLPESWHTIPSSNNFRVKVLPDGMLLKVVKNE